MVKAAQESKMHMINEPIDSKFIEYWGFAVNSLSLSSNMRSILLISHEEACPDD
jgi:hypothetical protein